MSKQIYHSTPIKQVNILNNELSSTPIRRSSIVQNKNKTPTAETKTDDTQERRRRREYLKQESVLLSPQQANLDESVVNKKYNLCKHLYTQNKITQKNAWDIPIIDLLHSICNAQRPNFLQEASISLDIGAKVYGLRVDYVHNATLILAKDLARVTTKENDAEAQDEDGVNEVRDESGVVKKAPKKKKKKLIDINGPKRTINENPPLLATLSKLSPVDFTSRIDSESGHIGSLYTNRLKEENNRFLILDEKTFFLSQPTPLTADNNLPHPFIANLLPLKPISQVLSDFNIKSNQEDISFLSQNPVLDNDGIPLHEIEASVEDHCLDMETEENDNFEDVLHKEPEYITTLCVNIPGAINSEYTFNPVIQNKQGQFIDKLWSGPYHWKLKYIKNRPTIYNGGKDLQQNERPKKRLKIQATEIEEFVKGHIPKRGEKTTRAWKPALTYRITLPPIDTDLYKIFKNPDAFMCKPRMKIKRNINHNENVNCNITSYNHENPIDSIYCSQGTDDNPMDDDHITETDEVLVGNCENYQDNLIDAPTTVPIILMNYAKKANRVNIKKLKDAIWEELAGSNSQFKSRIKEPRTFQEIYSILPNRLIGEKMEGLSRHVAFVTMLHLANEKKLKLEPTNCFDNFIIRNFK